MTRDIKPASIPVFLLSCLFGASVAMAQGTPPQGAAAAEQQAKKAAGSSKSMVQTSKPVTLTATVEAIDQTNRLVTLKGPQGNLVDVHVDESYTRFNELKVGDEIKATYTESIALRIRQPGESAPTGGTAGSVARVPGGTSASHQTTASVTIMAIDPATPAVTVKGPKGNVVSMRVQDPKRLEGLKVGDVVDVTYTEALLVGVVPVAKK